MRTKDGILWSFTVLLIVGVYLTLNYFSQHLTKLFGVLRVRGVPREAYIITIALIALVVLIFLICFPLTGSSQEGI